MSAIGGFGTGLAQGLKLGTDIAESAQKSQLIGMQVKQLQRENDEKDQIAAVTRKWVGVAPTAPTPQGSGSAQPQAASGSAEGSAPEGSASGGPAIAEPSSDTASAPSAGVGIATPKAASAPTNLIDGKPFDMNNLDHLSRMNAEINAVRASFGKISPLEIAQQTESFSKLKTSGAFRAAQDFMAHGDAEKARAEFAKAGYAFPEGTSFEVKNSPLFPGAPASKNVVVTTPDGRTFDSNSLMRGAMDIKDVAHYDMNLAVAAADVQYKFAVIGESRRHNIATEGIQRDTLNQTIKHQNDTTQIQRDTLDQTIKYQDSNTRIAQDTLNHTVHKDGEQLAISRGTLEATLDNVKRLAEEGDAKIKLYNAQLEALKDERARKALLEEASVSQKNLARFSGHDLSVTDKTLQQWAELGTPESKKMLATYQANMSKWFSLLEARELNLDPETRKQRFTDVELAALARDNPKLDYTYNKDIGLWSAQYRGKELFVARGANDPDARLTSPISQAPQANPGAAQGPGSRPGITPPPASSQSISASNPVQSSAQSVIDSASQANAQRAADQAAALEPLRAEAAAFTPDVIRAMKPTEAARVRTKYAEVLTTEQTGMLLRRAKQ